MCGIAGAVGRIDDRVLTAVRRAHGALRHRGPDADGEWVDASHERGIALAHRRLAIIDLSASGTQPMHDEASGLTIAFNGEIYNFRALRAELESSGHAFRTKTDTEVILKAHAAWGDAAVDRLQGMFAYALFDREVRRTLLVRDRMGIKPVYYAQLGEVLVFASELRGILAMDLLERRIDPDGLASYLWNGFVVGPNTIVEGVRLLPAGSSLAIDRHGALSFERYWSPPPAVGRSRDTAELENVLLDAVGGRLVADVPVGVFLSGGIDSSAIACLAARASTRPVETFNIGFEESEFDESQYARRVAASIGTNHHDIRLSEDDFGEQLDDALASIDQPTFDAINTYVVSRAVRQAGLTVALAGTGGDELFGGYASFRDLPMAARWSRRVAFAPESGLRVASAAMVRLKTGRPGEVGPQTRWGKLGDALATRGDLLKLYQVSYGLFTQEYLGRLRRGQPSRTELGLPVERAAELADVAAQSGTLGAISLLEQALFLGERLLRDTDAASMAVALEVRVPLLDHRIIEALARLDESVRFMPLGRKKLLRTLGMPQLDPTLFDRPKSGFVLPLEVWCRRQLRSVIDHTFGDAELIRQVGLSSDAIGRLWRSYQSQAPGLYWSRVWSLFILLRWCRTYGMKS